MKGLELVVAAMAFAHAAATSGLARGLWCVAGGFVAVGALGGLIRRAVAWCERRGRR